MRLENGYMMITRLKVQREEPKPLRSQILVMKFGFHQILVNLTQVYDKAKIFAFCNFLLLDWQAMRWRAFLLSQFPL